MFFIRFYGNFKRVFTQKIFGGFRWAFRGFWVSSSGVLGEHFGGFEWVALIYIINLLCRQICILPKNISKTFKFESRYKNFLPFASIWVQNLWPGNLWILKNSHVLVFCGLSGSPVTPENISETLNIKGIFTL